MQSHIWSKYLGRRGMSIRKIFAFASAISLRIEDRELFDLRQKLLESPVRERQHNFSTLLACKYRAPTTPRKYEVPFG